MSSGLLLRKTARKEESGIPGAPGSSAARGLRSQGQSRQGTCGSHAVLALGLVP